MKCLAMAFGLASLLAVGAPARADEAKLLAALELFDAAALWRDAGGPVGGAIYPTGGIIRWDQPLRAHLGSSTMSSVRELAGERLREAAQIAGLALEFVDSAERANLKLVFLQEYQATPGIQWAGCLTSHRSQYGRLTDVTVYVRLRNETCMAHELMHAFGFRGHPHQLDTVLSYTRRNGTTRAYTDLDRLVLRALYHGKISPGAYSLPALVAARQFLAEELSLVSAGGNAKGFANTFMDDAVVRLRAEAQKGNAYIQMQLGNAYAFAHYVEKDMDEAVKFWEMAAAQKNAEAIYRLANAALSGQGLAQDPVAARLRLQDAIGLGHGQAAFAFATALRDGVGGQADPVEAFAFFDLASRRSVSNAATARDSLAGTLSEDQKVRARTRAEELPTSPPR